MITRASDVKPHCEVCAYSCDRCGFEIFQQTAGKSFTPIRKCPTEQCSTQGASNEETVYPQTRGSKFTKFQEIKLQELPNQVPIGHIPRCMNVQVTGELTRTTSPGDTVTISGVFLPTKFEVRLDEERSDEITTQSIVAQTARSCNSIQDAPTSIATLYF